MAQPPEQFVVAGGSVAGLATALALARAGRRVTVVERDDVTVQGDAEEAFASERRGAPQAHQTHGLLARLRVELATRFPDVLETLEATGAYAMPTTRHLPDVQPDDDQLSVLIVRRTTLEWVLRRAVLAEASVQHRGGTSVAGVRMSSGGHGVTQVTGAVLADGTVVEGDVVVATGRRGDVGAWLAPAGVEIPETVQETGFVYLTRWYRLPSDSAWAADPKMGGDLGYVKYLAVPGDGGTLSATIAVRARDGELRAALSDPRRFDAALAMLPGPDGLWHEGPLEAIGAVRPMGGLVNRIRRFLDTDGSPRVLGLHAVGDAHTCTNPIYGRGCALALVQAGLLADAVTHHPHNRAERAMHYEAACAREVEPWYHVSVQMDEAGREMARTGKVDTAHPFFALFVRGATDPVVGRALLRMINLLARPDELMNDAAVVQRGMQLVAEAAGDPLPVNPGPTRDELLGSAAA
ncbi:MAG: NAD(P)/FAD-dependent oxidoreductase [Acidimicrobiales bacterium]